MMGKKLKNKVKKRVICKKCCIAIKNDFASDHPSYVNCPICGRKIDTRIRTEEQKKYNKEHPQRWKRLQKYFKENKEEISKISRERVRKVVLNIISGNNPRCANCGCDDIRLLEINHKDGGGSKERLQGRNQEMFVRNIYKGIRKTNDLNLLCRVCNSLHYLELKFGKLLMEIIWRKKNEESESNR